jgi:hypothetical protein
MLVAENPGVFDANPDLPKASQEFLATAATSSTRAAGSGRRRWSAGPATRSSCTTRAPRDAAGKPLPTPLDYATLFTNDFLP